MSVLIGQFASDPKSFPKDKYPALAAEVRSRILDVVGRNGGHLASNLGVVELTIALLATFDSRRDKVTWDVSHQTYAWKILTGRDDAFDSIRKLNGISGFLKRNEGDAFGAGHAGTAISAALGMAVARDVKGERHNVIAVVGDGSIGNGISLEALNDVASLTGRFILVLNDNEMSISENVGALSHYFTEIISSRRYNKLKNFVERSALKMRLGSLRRPYHWIEKTLKGLFVGNGFFESMGMRYVGPIDGHDFRSLTRALEIARDYDQPIVLHIVTKKGQGYAPAEREPEKWHGVGGFDVATGKAKESGTGYSSAFGSALCKVAEGDDAVAGITAAMRDGTGMADFAQMFPKRFFDVGISEEHAVTFAAGLAASGLKPVVALYSTFAQRAVDCIEHDVCLQNLPVVFCLDRAGIVGSDGPTHHGVFDIAMTRCIPNLVIMQPNCEDAVGPMLKFAIGLSRPCLLRYPRGGARGRRPYGKVELGKAEVVSRPAEAAKVWIWALGDMLDVADGAARKLGAMGIPTGVVDPVFIKPLDADLLKGQVDAGCIVATIENGVLAGGFGSAVAEAAHCDVLRFGWPDEFVPHGSCQELMAGYGLTADAIAKAIAERA